MDSLGQSYNLLLGGTSVLLWLVMPLGAPLWKSQLGSPCFKARLENNVKSVSSNPWPFVYWACGFDISNCSEPQFPHV